MGFGGAEALYHLYKGMYCQTSNYIGGITSIPSRPVPGLMLERCGFMSAGRLGPEGAVLLTTEVDDMRVDIDIKCACTLESLGKTDLHEAGRAPEKTICL